MSDVEIVGRPLYRPVKHKLKGDQKPINQLKPKESNKPPTYSDIEYIRDEKDWWWCEDV